MILCCFCWCCLGYKSATDVLFRVVDDDDDGGGGDDDDVDFDEAGVVSTFFVLDVDHGNDDDAKNSFIS